MSQAYEDPLRLSLPELVSIEDAFRIKCSVVASLTFLLFDHTLTWPMELKYVWKAQWSWAKCLYIATRYLGISILTIFVAVFFNSVNSTFCHRLTYASTCIAVIMFLLVEAILIARLYAVYNCSKVILASTSFFALGSAIYTITMILTGTISISRIGVIGCDVVVPGHQEAFGLLLIPQMISEGYYCILMVIKVYSVYTVCGAGQLLRLLIRDSVIYFFGTFGILLVNTIFWNTARATLAGIAISCLIAVPCVLGCRLLLNMRQRAAYEETLFSQLKVPMTRLRFRTAEHQAQCTPSGDFTIGTNAMEETWESED